MPGRPQQLFDALDEGDGFKVVRMREDSIEVGEIRGAEEGRPIHGEVVKLTPRPEHRQRVRREGTQPDADVTDVGSCETRREDRIAGPAPR